MTSRILKKKRKKGGKKGRREGGNGRRNQSLALRENTQGRKHCDGMGREGSPRLGFSPHGGRYNCNPPDGREVGQITLGQRWSMKQVEPWLGTSVRGWQAGNPPTEGQQGKGVGRKLPTGVLMKLIRKLALEVLLNLLGSWQGRWPDSTESHNGATNRVPLNSQESQPGHPWKVLLLGTPQLGHLQKLPWNCLQGCP